MSRQAISIAFCFGILLAASPAIAQQKKAATDAAVTQALRKAQGMVQQLSDENAQLNEQVLRLQAQLDLLAPKAKQFDRSSAELAQQANAATALREQNRGLVERTGRDAARIRELQDTAALARQDNALLARAVLEREQWNAGCAARNEDLRKMNDELLVKYQQKGIWQALRNAEPVTQIGHVAEEREAQAYRFKLEDLRATPLPSTDPGRNAPLTPSPAR